ncbi:unnamed protein product [Phytomonas sp. Hart1]|nr:unnamed protein product [Phytomonas sp. Hart1]|eukprot:CCW69321.1 unnamed protein product [Phytomonas sp. isolate Hart1]
MGLVDAVVDATPGRDLLEVVMEIGARGVGTREGRGGPSWSGPVRALGRYPFHLAYLAWMEHRVSEGAPRGVRALHLAVQAVRLAVDHVDDFDRGVVAEEALFRRCLAERPCAAMQHLLRAADRALREGETRRAAIATLPFRRAVVLGAGAVGSSLAFLLIQYGLQVVLVEPCPSRQRRVLAHIRAAIFSAVRAKLYPSLAGARSLLSRLSVVCSEYHDLSEIFSDADIVFECITGSLGGKREVFSYLGRVCTPACVLVAGSGTIDVSSLASAASHPERVLGMHFYPPANESPVVEISRLPCTDSIPLHRVLALSDRLNKYVVLTHSGGGSHLGMLLLLAGLYQAYAMLEDGCFPHDVDGVLKKHFNFRFGIFEVEDMIGLDVMAMARANLPPRRLPVRKVFDVADKLVECDLVGRKRGEGWYRYKGKMASYFERSDSHGDSYGEGPAHPKDGIVDDEAIAASLVSVNTGSITAAARGSRSGNAADEVVLPFRPNSMTSTSVWNPIEWRLSNLLPGGEWQTLLATHSMSTVHNRSVEKRILSISKCKGFQRRYVTEEEIIDRVLLVMINEAARLLGEGIVESTGDVDCVSVYALGFPGWKGGLLYYADEVLGIDKILKRMNIMRLALGKDVFPEPCEVLLEMQKQKLSFARRFNGL